LVVFSGPKFDGLESPSETSSGENFPDFGEKVFAHCKTSHEKPDRDAFGRSIPKYRTAWRIVPNQPCVNYYVLSAEVVPSSEKKVCTALVTSHLVSGRLAAYIVLNLEAARL
ncbi:hypothetical protein ANCCAN_08463, partial [Ancylostoma caninum]